MSEPTDHLGREVSGEDQPQTVDDFAAEQGNLPDDENEQQQTTGRAQNGPEKGQPEK